MSESPKSRMFRFAAMLNWAKNTPGYRYVLPFLVVALFFAVRGGTVSAQTTVLTGGTPIQIVIFTADYTEAERDAAMRAVNYWNEIIGTSEWNRYGFNGVLNFSKDATLDAGSAFGNSTTVVISSAAASNWITDRNTQLKNGTNNLESLLIHELGHSLGINYLDTEFTINEGAGTVTVGNIIPNGWADFLYTPIASPSGGVKLSTLMGATIPISGQFTFRGENAMQVFGDGSDLPVPVESVNLVDNVTAGSTLIHPFTQFGNLSARYNDMTRPFLSEVELAIMKDLGHDINLKNYFGRSFYQTHAGTITVSANSEGNSILLGGMYGIGLHLVAANNRIVLDTDITTSGYAGAGIRIENNDNIVTINEGIRVTASGTNAIGVLITHTGATAGDYRGVLVNRGRIDATGTGGTGVYISNLSGLNPYGSFDNSGIINAGTTGNNAIYIDRAGPIGSYGAQPMTGINFMRGTTIVGNITNHESNTYQVLTFGKLADADGRVTHAGDPGDFVIRVDGGLFGRYDIETWGGTTIIEQDLNIPGGWLYVGSRSAAPGANTSSTLILRGNVSGLAVTQVSSGNTLVAAGTEMSGGTTFSNSAPLRVDAGATLSPSMDTRDFGRLNIDGTLLMSDNSTLRVDLGPGNNSDRIIITETNTATIGVININLTTLEAGIFTLVTMATAGNLTYDPAGTIILANGTDINIPTYGRKTTSAHTNASTDTSLILTVNPITINTANLGKHYHLTWTGVPNSTSWDNSNTTVQNWKDDAAFTMWFQDGDAVTFDLSGTNTLTIVNPVTVGEMLVKGDGDWTFNGDIVGTPTQITDISDDSTTWSTGGLTVESTGTVNLNGTSGFIGDIMLNGGVKVVDTITYSRTVVDGSSYTLATAQNLFVGTTGFARLDLFNGATAAAGSNIYIGGGNNNTSEGIINVGTGSTLATGGNVYVGGSIGTPGHDGRGVLTGNGNIFANTVYIYETGILHPGNPATSSFDALTINGNLWMSNNSTLNVNIGGSGQTSHVNVIGTADVGAININLSTPLFLDGTFFTNVTGTHYTLITSHGLTYQNDSAVLQLNGVSIPLTLGRWNILDWYTANTGTNLELTLDGTLNSYHVYWTGSADGTSWDWTTANWWGYNPDTYDPENPDIRETDTFFIDGDVVWFTDEYSTASSTRVINITGGNGNNAIVAGMLVEGRGDWTFNGNILGDATLSSLYDPLGVNTYLYANSALIKDGTGRLTLNGDNEFKGGFWMNGGTTVLTGNNVFGDFGSIIASGTLQIGNGGTTGSVSGDILNNGRVVFNRNDNYEFVDDISGTGTLIQMGGGALLLSGNNTYKGLTTVSSGLLLFGERTNDIGAVTVQSGTGVAGVLDANNNKATTLTANGMVNNSGSILNLRRLDATGSVENSGEIYEIDRLRATGNINNNGLIRDVEILESTAGNIVNRSNGGIAYIQRLTARNVDNNGGTIFDVEELTANNLYNAGRIENIGTMNVADVMSNAGSIFKVGALNAGSVTNSGYVIDAGTVAILGSFENSGVFTGDIADPDSIIPSLTAGSITNTGYLMNVREITSNTFLNQNGAIAGIQRINMGVGSSGVQGTFVNQGGTIVVGDVDLTFTNTGEPIPVFTKIGTLTIDGDFSSTSGVFVIGVNGSNNSLIDVSGTATITNGIVNVIIDSSNYVIDHRYVFLTAEEGLFVVMDLIPATVSDPLFKAVVRHDNESSYWLTISRAFSYAGEGKTTNQRRIGRYLDQVGIYPGGDFRNVLMALDKARVGEAARAAAATSTVTVAATTRAPIAVNVVEDPINKIFDQMSGSVYGTMTTASVQNTVMFHASLANVLRRDYNTINTINTFYGSGASPTGNLWGMVYGHAGSFAADDNAHKYRHGFSGIMAGFDRINERYIRLGLFLSMGQGSLSSELEDRVLSDEFMLGHYFRRDTDRGYLLVQGGVGNHRYDTRRRITFGSLEPDWVTNEIHYIDRTARNEHSAFLGTAHVEAGLRYRNTVLNLAPFVGLQYTGLIREGFTERGAGSLNLTSKMQDYHSFRTMFGMRFDTIPFRVRNGLASFYGNVAWMYEFEADKRHTEFTARFSDAGVMKGATFTVDGNDPGRDWVQAGWGLNFDFNANVRGFTGYDAHANQKQVLHSANLGFVIQR